MLSPLPRADGQLTGWCRSPIQPSLALAIATADPAVRLRALLEIMRPDVDEVVVGIDQHGDPDALDACVDIADRRLALDLRDAVGPGALAWVHHHCTAGWVLALDVDEVPSAALLHKVWPTTGRQRSGLGEPLGVPPSGRLHRLPPWTSDMKPRILRNPPGIWRFGGRDQVDGGWRTTRW